MEKPNEQIEFDHMRLWLGIGYHVIQSHQPHWKEFTKIYGYMTLGVRLMEEKATATISRFRWRHFTDVERFDWLMSVTHTALLRTEQSEDTAIFIKDSDIPSANWKKAEDQQTGEA